jgi:hypothetical protein
VCFQLLLLFGVQFIYLFIICCICLCVDIVPVSFELPIGSDQQEPIFEEEYTQIVEEGKWLPPSVISLGNLYHCMLKQCLLYLLQCVKLMGKHLFKDLTRCFTLLP